jgi:hypothetical protein
MKSGAIDHYQYLALEKMNTLNFTPMVRHSDPQVTRAADMRLVPKGSILAFIDPQYAMDDSRGPQAGLAHAMIAVGDGWAAGTKNDCIGIGAPVDWELLDLANRLSWTTWGEINQTKGTPRKLILRYRTLPLL